MSVSVDDITEPARADVTLTQVLYRSRSVVAVESGMQMSDILDEARVGNSRDQITGVLTSVGGYFVQIIEGPEAVIDRLLIKLEKDRRHTELDVLARRVVNARLFGDWDMVSPRLATVELAALGALIAMPSAGIDDYAKILMAAIAQQEAVLDGRRSRDPDDRIAEGFQGAARHAQTPLSTR